MHSHAHCDHQPTDFGVAFGVGIALNASFVVAEVFFGIFSHSLSLVADAGHNLGDVLGLIMAWAAASLAVRPPTPNLTYGYRRSSILAALANSGLLLVGVGAIAWEAILRLAHPASPEPSTIMIVAAVGIGVNGFTAYMFARGRHGELNVRGAYVHMLADAVIAAGVVGAGLAIRLTGLTWIDPFIALVIAALIARSSWSILRESAELAMDAVPRGVNSPAVREFLGGLPGVTEITDLHIWAVSTSENALTAHLVAPDGLTETALEYAESTLRKIFSISHCTIQVARTPRAGCSLTT